VGIVTGTRQSIVSKSSCHVSTRHWELSSCVARRCA
jgi:hypothetical protein